MINLRVNDGRFGGRGSGEKRESGCSELTAKVGTFGTSVQHYMDHKVCFSVHLKVLESTATLLLKGHSEGQNRRN